MDEYIEFIEDRVEQLLNGACSVTEFQTWYYHYYLEQIPGEFLSEEQWRFFNALHQSLDRSDWNKDDREYICWVDSQRQQYLKARNNA